MRYRVRFLPIRHFRNKKRAGAEMHPAIFFVSGIIIIGGTPLCYWPIFSLSLVTVPEVFMNVISSQFPSCV